MSTVLFEKLIKQPEYDLKAAIHTNRGIGLWRMLVGYRRAYAMANITLGVSALAKTLTLVLLSAFIDRVLSRPNPYYIGKDAITIENDALRSLLTSETVPVESVALELILLVALGFVALASMEGIFSFLSGRYAAEASEGVAYRLRNYLFDHVQRLSFTYHDKNQTGDILQRCTSDVDAIRRFFAEQAVGVGRIILLFAINFTVIALIDWQLAIVSTLVVPFVVVISLWFFRRVSDKYDKFQEQEAVLSTRLQENLTGVRVVKAFARQQYEIDKFDRENWEQYQRGREMLVMHAFFWPTLDFVTGLQLLASYYIGAMMVIDGTLSVGNYVAFAGMLVYIIFPMRNLGRLIVQMSTGFVSYDRVANIIRENREPLQEGEAAPVERIEGAVKFENVSFEYDPGVAVLNNISFEAKPGQVIALMGATGSGKTSVVNLLLRFYENQRGKITIDGHDLRDFPRDFLRHNIGIVEQEPFLFSRSIRENISYGVGREVSDEEVFKAARAAAIHHVIEGFPEGYKTMVGERGVTLSGGQKQRVAVARTLLKNPRILVMDDATSSVDTETEAAIRMALNQLMPGRTSFIIAHRVQTVMNADLILVFDHGQIVQRGTHDELIKDTDGVYRRIFDLQSRIDEELAKEISGE